MNENKMKVPFNEKFTYGFGNLAANLMITTVSAFISFYYTDVVGLSAVVVANILLWSRLLDGVSDLMMGGIVDKTKTPEGKARPWIKRMAIPYALALVLLFTSPDFLSDTGKSIYAFVTYCIAMAGVYTATMVPYNTLIGASTSDPVERSHLATARSIFGFGGALVVNMIVWPVVNFYGGDKPAWTFMAITFGFISTVLLLILYFNSQERVTEEVNLGQEAREEEKQSTITGLKNLLKNKYWLILIAFLLLTFVSSGLGGINIYYAQWILGDPSLVGLIGFATFLPIIVCSFFMPFLFNRFSKKTLCIAGLVISIIARIGIVLNPTDFEIIFVMLIITGIGATPAVSAGYAMLGDVSDFGEWKNGIRNDGLIFAAGTFAEKVGAGFGGLVLGLVLNAGGYVSLATTQSDDALLAIQAVFSYIPIIFAIVSIIILFFYDLDKKLPHIQEELKIKRSQNK